jgi:hypothetical protein
MTTQTKLTKKQALAQYKALNADFIKSEHKYPTTLNSDWQCYCDMLARDGKITEKQRMTWDNPF